MQIFNTPVKIGHTPTIVLDWIRNAFMRKEHKHRNSKYTFVYFSYEPDFEFLSLSLRSLMCAVSSKYIRSVYLFVDQKAPFSLAQLDSLKGICDVLIVEKIYDFSWASTETTLAEMNAFVVASQGDYDTDFVAKVDSDILFFRNTKLKRLLHSKHAAVADGHHLDYKYGQGGFYMIRKSIIKKLFNSVASDDIKLCEIQCQSLGEDRVISTYLKNKDRAFYLTRLMLFPDEYSLVNRLSAFVRWEFCTFHFVKDKQRMSQYASKFAFFEE